MVSLIPVPQAFNENGLCAGLRSIFGRSLLLEREGFDFAGSMAGPRRWSLLLAPAPKKRCLPQVSWRFQLPSWRFSSSRAGGFALVRAGADLGDWLAGRRITVVSTVPTLAAL